MLLSAIANALGKDLVCYMRTEQDYIEAPLRIQAQGITQPMAIFIDGKSK